MNAATYMMSNKIANHVKCSCLKDTLQTCPDYIYTLKGLIYYIHTVVVR